MTKSRIDMMTLAELRDFAQGYRDRGGDGLSKDELLLVARVTSFESCQLLLDLEEYSDALGKFGIVFTPYWSKESTMLSWRRLDSAAFAHQVLLLKGFDRVDEARNMCQFIIETYGNEELDDDIGIACRLARRTLKELTP